MVMTPPNGQRCLVNAMILVGNPRVISECQCELWLCCGLEKERSCGIACTVSSSSRTRILRHEIQTTLPALSTDSMNFNHIHLPSEFLFIDS